MSPRVLHLGKFYPPDRGGIESVTSSLARGAACAGFAVQVLCFAGNGHSAEVQDGVEILRVHGANILSQPLSLAYARLALQLSKRADIVHVHMPNMLAALAVTRISPAQKVVLHWHSDLIGKGVLGMVLRPLEAAALRRADAVICTSSSYAEASQSLRGFMSKVVVIPIGVSDPAPPSRDGKVSLPTALREHIRNRPLVLSVGRLVPYKGFDVLIEAVSRMSQDAAVVVVGGGPLASSLSDKVKKMGVHDRVFLAGRVGDEELHALQDLATVFCMPSINRAEAFGVAIIEAMSRGTPVVASRIAGSGVPWVNMDGESGINVRPGDASELANAVDRLLKQKDFHDFLSVGARKRFESLFTERQSVDCVLDLYRSLLRT